MKDTLKIFSVLSILLVSSSALAAGGEGIPTTMITFQAINVGLFIALIGYLVKGPLREYFKAREDDFSAAARKAEELLASAEKNKKDITEKLEKLEASANQTIENAKKEAEILKNSLSKEADEMVAKIKSEGAKSAANEIARAKEELRRKLLDDAVKSARTAATKGLSDEDQRRLNGEFVEKVSSVGTVQA